METSLVKPIKFRKFGKTYLPVGASLVLLSLVSAYVLTRPDIGKKIERQPIVREINSFGYLLRDKGEVKSAETEGVTYKLPPEFHILTSAKWVPQTFNNCGPAATAMALQYFGVNVSQEETKAHLRTGDDDKNIFMYQISDYMRGFGVESKIFFNGDIETVKTLIANDIYVMVEDWLHPGEDIGHVLILTGYDDKLGVFIGDDPYLGTGVKFPYSEFDEGQWKPFNREFVPVYRSEKENLVKAIVGENWSESKMYQNSVKRNERDVQKNPGDMYAYFNLGTSYYALGEYQKAKEAFEKSKMIGWPARMLWYQIEPIQTYNKLGEYQKALEFADKALAGNDAFAEVHFEKAVAYRGLGKMDKANEEIQKTLSLDPNYRPAKEF